MLIVTRLARWWCAVEWCRELQSQQGVLSGQARQLVDRCACECYERRGMMYLRQSCRAGSMRDHTSKKGQRYGGVTGSVSDWLHVTVYG